jgi:hypothetical protein
MDAAALRTRIQATLSANADARRQAELDLRNVLPSAPTPQGTRLTHLPG